MNYREQQQKEIATIKPRNITLNLSDADCERIAKRAGSHSLTVAQLLENVIGDLVGGTYSNGSDERDYADNWFNRCWFGMYPEETLLKHFIDEWIDVEDFLDTLDNIKTAEEDIKAYQEKQEAYDEEEISYIKDDLEYWQEQYHDSVDEWLKNHKDADIEKEIEKVRKWLADYESLKGE